MFIDATDPLRPIHVLPEKILNVRGLVIKKDKPEWVFLSCQKPNSDMTVVNVALDRIGSVKVNFDTKYGEYSSLSLRSKISGKSDLDFVKEEYDIESMGFIIDSTSIMSRDSTNLPLRIQGGIYSENYSQVGGDLIYFNPNILFRLIDNPFKAKERKFPIDYAYPRVETIITNITIPEGYELKEKFEDKKFSVSNVASFTRAMEVDDNIIQIMSKMEIKQSEIKSNHYHRLKEFYARIIASESEMLVFGPIEVSGNVGGSD
jgi:hypothetical protein